MTATWDPFDRPQPTFSCLRNEALLLQAWKKSHAYIRTHNWYADVLELDLSAANLRQELLSWEALFDDETRRSLRPKPMRLVPAPKTREWEFADEGETRVWRPSPKDTDKTLRLRPLAHLSIRDQTLSTAVMICCADLIETIQGDCSVDTAEARRAEVVSYGNRLFCQWDTGASEEERRQAKFNWGNANCYRKYYTDYKKFIKRPLDVCDELESSLSPNEELGVVSLDLSGFYDRIGPSDLLRSLQKTFRDHSIESDQEFWKCASRIVHWRWNDLDDRFAGLVVKNSKEGLPDGLPQGLVASGFFSNAYMHSFDAALKNAIKSTAAPSTFQIHDYCRYVDDMRIVVSGNIQSNPKPIIESIENLVTEILNREAKGQTLNKEKSSYSPYRGKESESRRASVMEAIQHSVSGPMDLQTLEETSRSIDLLLLDSKKCSCHKKANDIPRFNIEKLWPQDSDVRDDTVKRFAAYRQLTVLRERRALMADEEEPRALKALDVEIEEAASNFVLHWSTDPSLTLVLRHAMNLFPSTKLLNPVLELLDETISGRNCNEYGDAPRRVCEYILADLFKAAVVETGLHPNPLVLPDKSDRDGYIELLSEYAIKCLDEHSGIEYPWYVKQQAILLLISTGDSPGAIGDAEELSQLKSLSKIASGRMTDFPPDSNQVVPLLLVFHQVTGNIKKTLSRLARWTLMSHNPQNTVEQVYHANEDLFFELMRFTEGKEEHKAWRDQSLKSYICVQYRRKSAKPIGKGKKYELSALIASADSPFIHENAVLHLLLALIEALEKKSRRKSIGSVDPSQVLLELGLAAWGDLTVPAFVFGKPALTAKILEKSRDPRYEIPSWCPKSRRWSMKLGMLVRAAITGDCDYTNLKSNSENTTPRYFGIRSSWLKRQHGMFQRPDALNGPGACCSPWISELLSKLLCWPGCNESDRLIENWHLIKSPIDLRNLITERLKSQMQYYGRASKTPVYIHPLRFELKSAPKITVVMVQTVLPKREDFSTFGATLSDTKYRPRRRSHLAQLATLALKQMSIRKSYLEQENTSQADLILFPELSVHEDDLDILERLVDKTKAIIFCGLVFKSLPNAKSLVNTGCWIVPDKRDSGRSIYRIFQGKRHMTQEETRLNISPWRPYQAIIELSSTAFLKKPLRLSGSICYDATDLSIVSDLRDITDLFVVPANNKDVDTFDRLASALSYHMYQHVAVINTGEFGGTAIMAPFKERTERVLSHLHGGAHASVSVVEIDLSVYQYTRPTPCQELKTKPAGYSRHE